MSIAPIMFSAASSVATLAPRFVFATLGARVSAIASTYFGLGQGVFFLGYGAKEWVVDGIIQEAKIKPLDPDAPLYTKIIHKIRCAFVKVFKIHGAMYVFSAIAWIAAELDKVNILNLGQAFPYVQSISNILFLGACSLAIGYQVAVVRDAIDLTRNGNDAQKYLAKCLKVSCAMGIIGNVGYIAAVGAMMFGGPTGVAAILGFVAVLIGCVRVMYDLKYLTPALERV
jgi:hypothetical protein